jgi:hypothetical protein
MQGISVRIPQLVQLAVSGAAQLLKSLLVREPVEPGQHT